MPRNAFLKRYVFCLARFEVFLLICCSIDQWHHLEATMCWSLSHSVLVDMTGASQQASPMTPSMPHKKHYDMKSVKHVEAPWSHSEAIAKVSFQIETNSVAMALQGTPVSYHVCHLAKSPVAGTGVAICGLDSLLGSLGSVDYVGFAILPWVSCVSVNFDSWLTCWFYHVWCWLFEKHLPRQMLNGPVPNCWDSKKTAVP